MNKTHAPVLIEFVTGSRIQSSEKSPETPLRDLHTFIQFETGQKVQLPADQIIHCEDAHGAARIGLGGMSFEGMENEKLVFWRVRDLLPDEQLHPERDIKVLLDTKIVAAVHLQGTQVWPRKVLTEKTAVKKRSRKSEPELHRS